MEDAMEMIAPNVHHSSFWRKLVGSSSNGNGWGIKLALVLFGVIVTLSQVILGFVVFEMRDNRTEIVRNQSEMHMNRASISALQTGMAMHNSESLRRYDEIIKRLDKLEDALEKR